MPPPRAGARSETRLMSNIINLNRYRKTKAREDASRHAGENRRRGGRTLAGRAREQIERRLAEDALDGKRLERDDD